MKKIVFEDASLELIRFGADVITSSGDIGGGSNPDEIQTVNGYVEAGDNSISIF